MHPNRQPGVVYWITGLSAAGKTTIGRLLHDWLLDKGRPAVFLDGDILREVFGNDLGHGIEDRQRSAERNSRLCKMLSDQGIDVVCATISMLRDRHAWNRVNIARYREIYLKAPMAVLIARDRKGVYSSNGGGAGDNVWGVDIPAEEPLNPDLVLENDGTRTPREQLERIVTAFKLEKRAESNDPETE